jgi:hypothetical protein
MQKYGQLLELANFYNLISIAEKVYGPYKRPDGRQIVIIRHKNRSRTVSYPKYLMEVHLRRPLDRDRETVDHINNDFNDNRLNNLRLVPRDVHSADDTRRVKNVKFKCSMCKKEFERSPRLIRDKSKKNKAGPFCSRQCAGKYSRMFQLKLIKKLNKQPYLESEYYRRKNIKAFVDYLEEKYITKTA